MPTIFLSAGEASGEHYGSMLIEALRRLSPEASFFGLGGRRMAALGFQPVVRSEDVAVMGITEVLLHMPRIYREYRRLKASLRRRHPDLAILIDFPDVNLRLARELHRLRVPVVFFVSPQLWAWKKRRIRRVQRYVDKMLVIFPFEEPFYRQRGVDAQFVGHPLAYLPLPAISRAEFAAEHRLDPTRRWIGLLPGSRAGEIRLNLPEMLKAAVELAVQPYENAEFLLPIAPTLTPPQIDAVKAQVETELRGIAAAKPGGIAGPPPVTLVHDARATLHHARASIVASGTATVEAALIGNPFVVVYRVSGLTYAVARRVVRVPFVAMVNLVAGREVVPELIQDNFTAANIVLRLRPLLDDEEARRSMQLELGRVRGLLQPAALPLEDSGAAPNPAIDQVARISLQLIHT